VADRLTIRPANAADRAFIEDLGDRTLDSSVATFRRAPEAMVRVSYERLLEIVFGQSHVGLIAERDGGPTGFLLMLDQLPDEVTSMPQGFVAYMAVEPAARRTGTARALLTAAEDEAKRRSLPYMGLMVTEENAAARALYEGAGYRTERRLLCKEL
jgi:ribosomal protein S18 acetylase RimI-like enzyme